MLNKTTWASRSEAQSLPNPPQELPSLIWQVLYSRGVHTSEAIKNTFSPSLKSLTSPWELDGIDLAVDRLVQALMEGETVLLYADFDLDGTPGLALMKQGLEELGFDNLRYYQPKRLSEGYGLHSGLMKGFAEEGVSLIVTIDVGITAVGAVAEAKSNGIDVIVTDHHLPQEELPKAVAVVNPNKGTCNSKLGHLCGAGVAFYIIMALRSKLKELEMLERDFDPKKLLDCFAIATITDMVPLVKENRTLVKHGLKQLEKTHRPGLKALLRAVELEGRAINSQDVGFRFAPKLNALSRMENGLFPIDIFLAKDFSEADRLIGEVLACNEERVRLQKEAEKASMEQIGLMAKDGFVFVASRDFHQGVVGLVATKMAQHYQVPAFIAAINSDGKITGSGRLPGDGGNLLDALGSCEKSLEGFGGHAPAAGFHLVQDDIEAFNEGLKKFYSHSAIQESQSVQGPSLFYDAEGELEDLFGNFMSWFEELGPYGMDFETPVFKFGSVKLASVRELRGGHLKLGLVSLKHKATVDALWFSPPPSHPVLVEGLNQGDYVEVLGEPQWNYFGGRKSIQLLLKDIRRV